MDDNVRNGLQAEQWLPMFEKGEKRASSLGSGAFRFIRTRSSIRRELKRQCNRLISRLDGFQRAVPRLIVCTVRYRAYRTREQGRGAGRYGQTDKQGRAYETWHLAIRFSDLPAASLRNNP
ncbi:unnamed protein product [Heterotrigona itama]|uniref:Uncharacterized protein n=1 Tax=Heterotrigona itama TaxID=395501 RepID=A0A6V7HHH4_9HYME|nr:unnamed protein product [Heterotrigona itama]